MDTAMDPAIAFRVPASEALALEVRVNFGIYSGRNATAAEMEDLARNLRSEVKTFAVVAEDRHQFGDDIETALHQVVIEVDGQQSAAVDEELAARIVAMANRWAADCIASRSELGELRD